MGKGAKSIKKILPDSGDEDEKVTAAHPSSCNERDGVVIEQSRATGEVNDQSGATEVVKDQSGATEVVKDQSGATGIPFVGLGCTTGEMNNLSRLDGIASNKHHSSWPRYNILPEELIIKESNYTNQPTNSLSRDIQKKSTGKTKAKKTVKSTSRDIQKKSTGKTKAKNRCHGNMLNGKSFQKDLKYLDKCVDKLAATFSSVSLCSDFDKENLSNQKIENASKSLPSSLNSDILEDTNREHSIFNEMNHSRRPHFQHVNKDDEDRNTKTDVTWVYRPDYPQTSSRENEPQIKPSWKVPIPPTYEREETAALIQGDEAVASCQRQDNEDRSPFIFTTAESYQRLDHISLHSVSPYPREPFLRPVVLDDEVWYTTEETHMFTEYTDQLLSCTMENQIQTPISWGEPMFQRVEGATGFQGMDSVASFQTDDIASVFERANIPTNFLGDQCADNFQGVSNAANFQNSNIPDIFERVSSASGFQTTDFPTIFQRANIPLNFQGTESAATFQGGDIPLIFQGGDIPVIFQETNIPVAFQEAESAPNFQEINIPVNFLRAEIWIKNQVTDIPGDFQGSYILVNFQEGYIPSNYQGAGRSDNFQRNNRAFIFDGYTADTLKRGDISVKFEGQGVPINFRGAFISFNSQGTDIPTNFQGGYGAANFQRGNFSVQYVGDSIPINLPEAYISIHFQVPDIPANFQRVESATNFFQREDKTQRENNFRREESAANFRNDIPASFKNGINYQGEEGGAIFQKTDTLATSQTGNSASNFQREECTATSQIADSVTSSQGTDSTNNIGGAESLDLSHREESEVISEMDQRGFVKQMTEDEVDSQREENVCRFQRKDFEVDASSAGKESRTI